MGQFAITPHRRKLTFALAWLAILLVPTASTAGSAQSSQQPPPGITLAPPPFHFSDPALERDYDRNYHRFEAAMAAYRQTSSAADRALVRARGSRLGSPVWVQARAAIQRAIEERRPAREAIRAFRWFLIQAAQRAPADEARYAMEVRDAIDSTLLGSSDRLVDQLALLAGISIGQSPP